MNVPAWAFLKVGSEIFPRQANLGLFIMGVPIIRRILSLDFRKKTCFERGLDLIYSPVGMFEQAPCHKPTKNGTLFVRN